MTNGDDAHTKSERTDTQKRIDKLRKMHADIGTMIEDFITEVVVLLDDHEEAVDIKPVPAHCETPIQDLDLNSKAFNLLMRHDIRTVETLVTYSDQELLRIPYMGSSTVDNIVASLKAVGYSLKQTLPEKDDEEA